MREWRDVTTAVFNEQVLPLNQPAVLRGLVGDWPAVRAGVDSPRAMVDYLSRFDIGSAASTALGDPKIGGRFFYDDTLTGFNFERRKTPLAETPRWMGSPFEALVHAMLAVRSLPPKHRAIWREFFAHYIFEAPGKSAVHLPPHIRGVQSPPTAETAAMIRGYLLAELSRADRNSG
jgi:hypothetical protein